MGFSLVVLLNPASSFDLALRVSLSFPFLPKEATHSMIMNNRKLYRCYIDESGDEGLTPSSRPFFFVTAVVFEDSHRINLYNTVDVIKKRIWQSNYQPLHPLHWNKMKDSQRIV